MAVQRDNPYPNHNFEVSIVGVADDNLGFSEVELPSGEIEVIEYREGRDAATVRKLPGLVKYPNVTLKRGVNGYLELYNWWKAARDGERPAHRRHDQAARRAAPGGDALEPEPCVARQARGRGTLNAQGNEVAIETLELAHEGFEIE